MLKKFLVAGCLFCVACAPLGASGPTLEQRVDEQDRELRQMRPQQADTWNEVQAMRQEINALKGQLNDLNSAGGARALADRVRQHDQALRQVDTNMALNLDLGAPMGTTAPAYVQPGAQTPAPTSQIVAPESSAYANMGGGAAKTSADSILPPPSTVVTAAPAIAAQTGAPAQGSYGLPPDQTQTTQLAQVQAPSESTWGQADPKPVLQVPKKDISLALFDAGLNDFNARKYAAAERSFKDFVKNYPGHSQSAEAQYYIAECEFQRNNFPTAALEYDAVITKFPKSSSAPGAYLKQGIAFSKMNNPDAARQRMQQLISKFPNSPEAARARSFLKTNK